VSATEAAGGEHVRENVYKGGKIVVVDGLVWALPDGSLHAVTTGEKLIAVPGAKP
jgi:hypothetical protein